MDINLLQAFVEVARKQSFSQATESLFLTQPAISKRIAQLENTLGTRLFDRIGKTVRLTEAGTLLLPKAMEILNSTADLQRLVNSLETNVAGTLLIGTSHHIGLHRLPPLLKRFIRAFPTVKLDMHFMDSEAACKQVENGELEFALVTLPETASDQLLLQPVWPDPLAVMVHADHILLEQDAIPLRKLAQYPAVLPGRGTYTRSILETVLAQKKARLEIALSTNYLETLRMLAATGLGWTLLPITMLNNELRELPVTDLHLQRQLGLVTHRQRTLSNAAKAFCTLCQNERPLG